MTTSSSRTIRRLPPPARARSGGRFRSTWAIALLALALPATGLAAGPQVQVSASSASSTPSTSDGMVSVIVKLKDAPVATYRGGVAGLAATNPSATGVQRINPGSPVVSGYRSYLAGKLAIFEGAARSAAPRARVLHRYDMVLGGMALQLPEKDIAKIATLPGVQAVYRDQRKYPLSEKSPQFIGAPKVWSKLGGTKGAGEGVIVGVLDGGVWPEHPSFADPDPSGKPYPAPAKSYPCEFSGGTNPGPAFTCNGKLIGAYRIMATHDAEVAIPPGEFSSARDDGGHGTHTASTAAGNHGVKATALGAKQGTISGIAPRAQVIAYRIVGSGFADDSDIVAAIQQAILDGVDVLNFSLGGDPEDPYSDPTDLAFRDAYAANVFVAAAGGNSGPTADSVSNLAGWETTVGASTEKQTYADKLTLVADDHARITVAGVSLNGGVKKPVPVVLASSVGDAACTDATPDGAFTGKIVGCLRAGGLLQEGNAVKQRGAVGMILYTNDPSSTFTDRESYVLPTTFLLGAPSAAMLDFLSTHTGVVGKFTDATPVPAQGDVMASFSSRGGADTPFGKPDVTAPGVKILAGDSPASLDRTRAVGGLFFFDSGTSMSAPHVAGAAALLRQLHPSWTAGQIKSALMTSASRKGLVKGDGVTLVDGFDAGSGRIALGDARDPGLTFDVPVQDYIDHQDDLWNVNYPNVFLPSPAPAVLTVQRTAHSELAASSTWKATLTPAADVAITAPTQITVPAGGATSFPIEIDKSALAPGEVRFAALDLASAGRLVHLPITVVAASAANLRVTAVSASSPLTIGGEVTYSLTVQNVGNVDAPAFEAHLYLSSDTTFSGDDVDIVTCVYDQGLAAGSGDVCSGTLPFHPAGTTPGTYFMLGVADTGHAVSESDETDNVLASGPIVVN